MLLQVLTHKNEADQKMLCTAFQKKNPKPLGLCFIFLPLFLKIGVFYFSLVSVSKLKSLLEQLLFFKYLSS